MSNKKPATKKRAAAKSKSLAPSVLAVVATWQESSKQKAAFGFVVSTHLKRSDASEACLAEHDAAFAFVMSVTKGTAPGSRVSIADAPTPAEEAP